MRTIAFSILALGTFAVAGPASAQQPAADIPTYDTDAYCEEVSQAVGGSYQIKATCIQQEKAARTAVQELGSIEARIRHYCDEVAEVVGGSYQIYQTCVAQEIKARDGEE